MDKQIDARFERVEKALGFLTDSIAKYNPSIAQAHDYIAADDELHKGLQERELACPPTTERNNTSS